ncbi:MAG: 3'-5' exonuclease [Acetivibrio sp.]
MNYIVMDLEWNQGMQVSEELKQKIPFEIIEIGAVKLSENRTLISEFHRVIRPIIYKELFPVTQSLVPIEPEELNKGCSFSKAISDFFVWCSDGGETYSFCTWGNTDLTELQRNMQYYKTKKIFTKPFFYYDVQKLFALQIEGKKIQKTLEYAVEYFGFEKKDEFHRALWDAEYTAKIFQKLDKNLIDRYYSIDCFHNPQNEEEEVFVNYGNYSKYISREFNTREDALSNPKIKQLNCFLCGRSIVRKIDWFSNNPKNYYCLGYCSKHGYLKGRIQVNRVDNGKRYIVKIVSRIGKEAARKLKLHYDEISEKK